MYAGIPPGHEKRSATTLPYFWDLSIVLLSPPIYKIFFDNVKALRSEFESPGEDHRYRKTEDQYECHARMEPFRQVQRGNQRIGDLQQQPGNDDIGSSYLEDVAAFKFVE